MSQTSHPEIWMVRAGKGGKWADEFLSDGKIAIGWSRVGSLDPKSTPADIASAVGRAFPDAKKGARDTWSAQLRKFLQVIRVGDPVATYDPGQRVYLLGEVESGPEYQEGLDLCRSRRVSWSRKTARDQLSVAARNSLGSTLAVFVIPDHVSAELRDKSLPLDAPLDQAPRVEVEDGEPAEELSEAILREDVEERAEQFIEDRIARLGWEDMQELVAGVLRAMGYRTRVSDAGPDRGVDIFASPDGLGLQEPRIFVEVKHRRGTSMGAPEIRAFVGGRQPGDRCLYVSTGGFSKEARYEAERSQVPVALITLPDLREMLVEYYDGLDIETRSLVPLRRIYWPVD